VEAVGGVSTQLTDQERVVQLLGKVDRRLEGGNREAPPASHRRGDGRGGRPDDVDRHHGLTVPVPRKAFGKAIDHDRP
jgi:hypothetical protein